MATYATYIQFTAYLQDSGLTLPNQAESERLLQRCEFEVDTLLDGFGAPDDSTGLKYNPATDLTTTQAAALSRAVCAQAQYHLVMGDDFFTQGQYDSWQGPDFGAKGALPYFGPRVSLELSGQGIARAPGIASISTSWYNSLAARLGGLANVRAN